MKKSEVKIVYINCDNVNLNPISISSLGNNTELLEALNDTLASSDSLNVDDKVKIPSQRRRSPSLSERRSNYEVTAKLFITEKEYNNWSIAKIKDAIDCLNRTTSLSSVDSLILSFNGISDDIYHDNNRLDAAASIWQSLAPEFPTTQLAVADFGPLELENFLNKLTNKARLPQSTQISLSNCCDPPTDLVQQAKKHDIQLTAHPDLHDILSSSELARALKNNDTLLPNRNVPEDGLTVDWVLKYTIIAHGRGVVADKGYVFDN
ncbi:hypothetical protein E3Q22_00132 [Wallemia mellicola]|uniref:GCS light chain n=1 Tax=Wallemia mellicola TaxID=1708541 RepID=A0A4T0S9S4_9BASI|nr:hypothetical protein E3Q22_00132 [Wallemia mellicola]TIB94764.1 hypothetical protein E3Q19_00136 [Wallemia mellicola]TIC08198.1 hypothetical protein E3Q16_00099 [Wallemia mellicola]TIC20749.1 hypothetical protein E3Q13_00426 [Wallemia mellicola]TIC47281.1 hypothetical protein E3Q08_00100 [Wallemia mellicola]